MWEFNISLQSFRQVQAFVALAARQAFDVVVGNDHQRINGKDLMGMFSLDYSRPLQVQLRCSEEDYLRFRREASGICL